MFFELSLEVGELVQETLGDFDLCGLKASVVGVLELDGGLAVAARDLLRDVVVKIGGELLEGSGQLAPGKRDGVVTILGQQQGLGVDGGHDLVDGVDKVVRGGRSRSRGRVDGGHWGDLGQTQHDKRVFQDLCGLGLGAGSWIGLREHGGGACVGDLLDLVAELTELEFELLERYLGGLEGAVAVGLVKIDQRLG